MAQAMAEDGGRVPMSPGLQATLLRAREYAASQSEAEVLLEHLLLALSEDADAATVLESCRIDLSRLRHDVAGYIGSLDDRVPPGTPGAPAISPTLTQVLKYATLAAQQGRRSSIDGAIVLAALVGDGRSMAASFLKAQGLTFEAAIRALREASGRPAGHQPEPPRATRAVELPVAEPAPLAPATPTPTSRADDILARARERVESRGARSDLNGAAPRGERRAPIEPPPEPQTAAPVEPIEPAPVRATPAPNAPDLGRQDGAARAPLDPQAHPSTPERPAPPLEPAESPARDQPPVELPSPAPPLPPPQQAAPPRPQPPPRPRPAPPSQQPAEADGVRLPVASWPSPQRPREAPPDAPISRTQPPAPNAGGGWAQARQLQPGGGQPSAPGETAAAIAPPQWPPAGQGARPELPRGPQSAPFEPGPPLGHAPDAVAALRVPAIDASLVTHSIPARLKQGRAQVVEVRIDRPPLGAAGGASRSYALRAETAVARAIAVRLRPAAGRFVVEASSPETQWDQGGAAAGGGRFSGDAAVWRFNVTPLGAGRGTLHLAISARTLGADGVLAETQLPDQTYAVRVTPGYGGAVARTGFIAGVAVASMLALKLAEGVLGLDLYFLAKQLLRL